MAQLQKIISSIEGFLPTNTTIVEVGAHHGYLLADVIQFIYTLKPTLLETLNFAIVERFKRFTNSTKKIFRRLFWRYYKTKKHYDDISEVKLENAYILQMKYLMLFL